MALVKSRGRLANISEKDAMAGHKAGSAARFDRPVGSGGGGYLK